MAHAKNTPLKKKHMVRADDAVLKKDHVVRAGDSGPVNPKEKKEVFHLVRTPKPAAQPMVKKQSVFVTIDQLLREARDKLSSSQ